MLPDDMLDKIGFWIVLIIWALIWATLIRLFLCIFKAWAIIQGEVDVVDEVTGRRFIGTRNFRRAYVNSFCSNGAHRNVDDYWLPFFVGLIELCAYPLLMKDGQWNIIGAWFGIKTASQWRYWGRTRTPYNRFLLGCLLPIGLSYLFLQLLQFVGK